MNETKPLFCGADSPVCVGETASAAVVFLPGHQRNKIKILLRYECVYDIVKVKNSFYYYGGSR